MSRAVSPGDAGGQEGSCSTGALVLCAEMAVLWVLFGLLQIRDELIKRGCLSITINKIPFLKLPLPSSVSPTWNNYCGKRSWF